MKSRLPFSKKRSTYKDLRPLVGIDLELDEAWQEYSRNTLESYFNGWTEVCDSLWREVAIPYRESEVEQWH